MKIEVHVEWSARTHLAGHLHTSGRGSAVAFEYARPWLDSAFAFAIDPAALPLRTGAQHGATLFGAIQDCGPDRWGRILVERAVRKRVLEARPYHELDYVLALDDLTRIGALRFRIGPEGPFLAAREGKIPPLVQLSALLDAAHAVHRETETAHDLRFLLGQGSPLGGARPKSVVALPNGALAIAKFPKPDDTRDIAAGEILALQLAGRAGLRTAGHRLLGVSGQHVSLITRFDREATGRIPFLSAHSLLALPAGELGAYTQLADGIRRFGDDTASDLRELWRRLIFSLLASNYDDHFHNHGFLMREPGRWTLSPAYDLNPVPEIDRARTPKTAISEELEEPSIDGALKSADRFGLGAAEAKQILRAVMTAVSDWRKVGRQLGLRATTLDAYASAFSHPLMAEAKKLV